MLSLVNYFSYGLSPSLPRPFGPFSVALVAPGEPATAAPRELAYGKSTSRRFSEKPPSLEMPFIVSTYPFNMVPNKYV